MAFKKGNTFGEGRPKGSKDKSTIAKELLNQSLWDKMSDRITNEGIDKCWVELDSLKGKDYVYAFLQLLEYFKPKLQRTTLDGDVSVNYQAEHKVIFENYGE